MKLRKVFESEYQNLKHRKIILKDKSEGYIVEELSNGMLNVLVVGQDKPQTVSPKDVDIQQSLSNLDKLKLIIGSVITDKLTVEALRTLDNVSDIDATLLGNGATFEDLYTIYKKYYLICSKEPVMEGLLGKVGIAWNKLNNKVDKAHKFSKGDYSAFVPQGERYPNWNKSDTEKIYHRPVYNMTMFKLNQPFPLNARDFLIKKGAPGRIMFTVKSPLVGSIEGYSPEILNMFNGGKYLTGSLITTTIAGQPLKLLRGHYLVEPRSVK